MAQLTSASGNSTVGRKRYAIRMDMTPMVDLAFLLLTFFVLTVTLNDSFVLQMQKTEEQNVDGPAVNSDRVLTMLLGDKDKVCWYLGTDASTAKLISFSKNGVRNVLLEKNLQIKKMIVLIRPSDKSRYKNLVDMLDEIGITHIDRYFIVKETPQDQKIISELEIWNK